MLFVKKSVLSLIEKQQHNIGFPTFLIHPLNINFILKSIFKFHYIDHPTFRPVYY